MKKIFLILLILISQFSILKSSVVAVDATPSSQVEKKAQDLLDRVATKVAQIANDNKKTFHGKVKSIGTESFTVSSGSTDKIINVNDATDFYRIKAGKRSDSDFKSLADSDDVVAVGTIDPSSGSMTAKQVIDKINRENVFGEITDVNKKIVTIDGKKIDLVGADIYKTSPDGKIIDAKYADFDKGTYAIFVAVSPDPKTGVFSSLRALAIPY